MRNHFIFLDFDGVLNTADYQNELRKARRKTYDIFGPLFDPKAVEVLRQLLERVPGSKIVIISSWAFEGLTAMRHLWKTRNLPSEVYDIANSISFGFDASAFDGDEPDFSRMIGKGQGVKKFLANRKDYGYIILDDVPDFFPEQIPHYVQVDPQVGLQAELLDEYVKILTNK